MLLFVTGQKDGDSWVASDGKEYRLGMINTPETNEPCGAEATAFTRRFLSSGFTVDAYATDDCGRAIAKLPDDDGRSLNVEIAKNGLGDGRYLEQFRHENDGRGVDWTVPSRRAQDRTVARPPRLSCSLNRLARPRFLRTIAKAVLPTLADRRRSVLRRHRPRGDGDRQ